MKDTLKTTIIKDDNFNTVGVEMVSPTGHSVYYYGISAAAPSYYKKEVFDRYFDEYLELSTLLAEKEALKKCESQFFDIALKALGEKVVSGVGFDFSVWCKRIAEIEARELEIVNSIK